MFAKFSPEAYTSLTEQGKQALFFSPGTDIAGDIGRTQQGVDASVFGGRRNADNGGYASYALKTDGLQGSYTGVVKSTVWKANVVVNDVSTSSNYLNGRSNGVTGSLSAATELPGGLGLHALARAAFSYYRSDMNRQTGNGSAKADGVSSDAAGRHRPGPRVQRQQAAPADHAGSRPVLGPHQRLHRSQRRLAVRRTVRAADEAKRHRLRTGRGPERQPDRPLRLRHRRQGHPRQPTRSFGNGQRRHGKRQLLGAQPGFGQTQFSVKGALNYRPASDMQVGLGVYYFGGSDVQGKLSFDKRF